MLFARSPLSWFCRREAPEVVISDGLKPRAAPQSTCVPPTCVRPLPRGPLQRPRRLSDRLFRGDEFAAPNVAEGSIAYFRWPEQQTFDRSSMGPVTRRVRESLESHVNQPLAPSAPPSRPGER